MWKFESVYFVIRFPTVDMRNCYFCIETTNKNDYSFENYKH